jgi:hypothetical protein
MKKRVSILFVLLATGIVFLNFASAAILNASITPNVGEVNNATLYNLTINNTDQSSGINFTQVNLTAPLDVANGIVSYGTSLNGTNLSVLGTTSVTLAWNNSDPGYELIPNGTVGYVWFTIEVSSLQTFNITVSTLDDSPSQNINSTNVSITIQDTTPPTINFVNPPNDQANLSEPYIPINITATDYNLSTITIFLYNDTGLVSSPSSTTSPFFYNFTSLNNGTYRINATANDSSGNNVSTSLLTVRINTSLAIAPCTPSWVCSSASYWGTCNASTNLSTCTNLTDAKLCGDNTGKPASITKPCTPTSANATCDLGYHCGDWTPTVCDASATKQTQLCTSQCNSTTYTNTRDCTAGTPVGSANSASTTSNSLSFGFYLVVVIIIISIIVVVFILFKLRNKPSSSGRDFDFGQNNKVGPNGKPPSLPPKYRMPPPRRQFPGPNNGMKRY